ncbi:MAG: hypothetical protein BWY57_00945 [Betaproteobacteria bacterium ADurb.Bin341]|nr:MAG: hypothetical protein BWY57_00945 [Betaproteobacteria bacterium ADurb.Bin341]
MTPQQIVGLAARLFALWLVVIALQIFGIATAMNQQFNQSGAFALYFMPALPLLLAVFLWSFPMFVAHKIVPRTHDSNTLRLPAREATAAASAIIGIWVLISMLPHLVASGGIAFFGGGTQVLATYFTPERTLQLLAVALQCAFGLFLVAKPWFIASKVFPAPAVGDEPAK